MLETLGAMKVSGYPGPTSLPIRHSESDDRVLLDVGLFLTGKRNPPKHSLLVYSTHRRQAPTLRY